MSAAVRGRPPGPAGGTLILGRQWQARLAAGETPEAIAESESVSPNWVRRASVIAAENAPSEARTEIRRFTPGAALRRACVTLHLEPRFRQLNWRVRQCWLEAVLAVHSIGDGFALRYDECGFEDEHDFAGSIGASREILQQLARRRMLDVDDAGISLPSRLGVTPKERVLRQPGTTLARPTHRSRTTADPRQTNLGPMGLPSRGGTENASNIRSDGTENHPFNGTENAAFSVPDDTETARAVLSTTTTTSERISSLGGGGGTEIPAGGPERGTENAGISVPDDTQMPRDNGTEIRGTEIPNLQGNTEIPAHVSLAQELLPLIGRAGTPEAREIEEVRVWLLSKTANQIRQAVGTRMEQPNARHAPDLSYFSKRVVDWAEPARYQAPPVSPPPLAPPEDPAATVAWTTDHPDNPTLLACWTVIRAALRDRSDTSVWRVLRPMVLRGLDDGELVISLPTAFLRDHVREKHGPAIERAWRDAWPATRRVDFQINPG